MKDIIKLYTLLVYSENVAGILNQITAVFTRRQVNIESLNVSASSIPGVHKYTITAWSDEDQIAKIEEQQEAVKGDLKTKMRELNKKEIVGVRFTAKYTAPYTRKKFDTDQFYKDYPEDTAMHKKYVSTTNVSESIKISENKKK